MCLFFKFRTTSFTGKRPIRLRSPIVNAPPVNTLSRVSVNKPFRDEDIIEKWLEAHTAVGLESA
jgi:hypothetical protein